MEGARGLAVLLVFFVHFHSIFGKELASGSSLAFFSRYLGTIGHVGVDLFFVISGFLIYGTVITKPPSILKFWKRRVQRIYPTFLAVFGVYLLLSVFFPVHNKIHGEPIEKATYILQNLLLLPGTFRIEPIITVAWSLSYEFAFYLTLPVVVSLTAFWRVPRPARIAIVFLAWIVWIVAATLGHLPIRFAMFLCGILVYELRSLGSKARSTGWMDAIALVLFGVAISTLYLGKNALPSQPGALLPIGPLKAIAVGIGCGAFCLQTFTTNGWLSKLLSISVVRWLGNMSYSYYLLHGLILLGFSQICLWLGIITSPLNILPILVASLACTFLASAALFRIVEVPWSLARQFQPLQPLSSVTLQAAEKSAAVGK